MLFKDYYKILGLPQTATADDIKRSYRKLALKYHPDKTSGDKTAEAKFREVKEAYEILSKPIRREGFDYDYKKHYSGGQTASTANVRSQDPQQRPQQRSAAAKQGTSRTKDEGGSLTASVFLAKAQSINRRYSEKGGLVDQVKLYNEINVFLKKSNIVQLLIWGDVKTNNAIIHQVLNCCNLLSYKYIDAIGVRLAELAGTDNDTISKVFKYCKARRDKINQQRVFLIAGIFLIILLFFLFVA
jgi:curved DNA-binding protein